jgi:hypothetical protein
LRIAALTLQQKQLLPLPTNATVLNGFQMLVGMSKSTEVKLVASAAAAKRATDADFSGTSRHRCIY